jgi:rod shape determining protein RodA
MALTNSQQRRLNSSRDPLSPFLHIDLMLVLGVLALSAFGAAMIYSATRGTDPALYDTSFLERQIIFIMVGSALMAGTALIPYERLQSWAPAFYAGGIVGLIAVLILGVERNGARSWFAVGSLQLQPSEFLKVGFIVVLASLGSRLEGDINIRQLATILAITAIPLALIMQQPDVGTALVFIAVTMGMLLIAGARFSHIVGLTAAGVGMVTLIWNAGILKAYQQDRLTSFIDPESVLDGAGYQQQQSQIAIGNGGVSGRGFGQGGQTQGEFVPEQHTDFIFTVVGEEYGFIGSAIVLGLFALVVWRIWRTAKKAADSFGALICIGVMTMVVFQMFQSLGMTTGIMPITGIPAPFMSYGGSSALTSFISVGLVLNVHMRRHVVRS